MRSLCETALGKHHAFLRSLGTFLLTHLLYLHRLFLLNGLFLLGTEGKRSWHQHRILLEDALATPSSTLRTLGFLRLVFYAQFFLHLFGEDDIFVAAKDIVLAALIRIIYTLRFVLLNRFPLLDDNTVDAAARHRFEFRSASSWILLDLLFHLIEGGTFHAAFTALRLLTFSFGNHQNSLEFFFL
jgi:hypothetical protein